jgi:hypothetical protein
MAVQLPPRPAAEPAPVVKGKPDHQLKTPRRTTPGAAASNASGVAP